MTDDPRLDVLWAPWRLAYVAAEPKPPTATADCFLCTGLAQTRDRDNLIVHRTSHSAVVLNKFPYNNGHVMVAPREHRGQLSDLADDQSLDLQHLLARLTQVLTELVRPDGFNIGLNLGRAAGAGLPGHLHWHLVPRWHGDTNFMPVFTGTKVIVQSLEMLYDLLHQRLNPPTVA